MIKQITLLILFLLIATIVAFGPNTAGAGAAPDRNKTISIAADRVFVPDHININYPGLGRDYKTCYRWTVKLRRYQNDVARRVELLIKAQNVHQNSLDALQKFSDETSKPMTIAQRRVISDLRRQIRSDFRKLQTSESAVRRAKQKRNNQRIILIREAGADRTCDGFSDLMPAGYSAMVLDDLSIFVPEGVIVIPEESETA